MELQARPCKLGSSTNGRTEIHGDDSVPALDFTITDFLLEKDELNALFGALTWESLFNTQIGDNRAPQVLHPKFAPRKYTEKHEGAIAIAFGPNQQDVEMDVVKLASISLEPLIGGLTKLSLQVQVAHDVDTFSNKLISRQNTEVEAQITFGKASDKGKKKQAELPLDHAGATKKDVEDDGSVSQAQAVALASSSASTH